MKAYKIVLFIIIFIGAVYAARSYNVSRDAAAQKMQAAEQAKIKEKTDAIMAQFKVEDVEVGYGEAAKSGDTVSVNYTGTLSDGKVFDSSYKAGHPFEFKLGANAVIRGWDLGIPGMKVGGTRKLIIPPGLAYGDQAVGDGLIPAGSTLSFTVTLEDIKK